MQLPSIETAEVSSKTVLVRVDYNVPHDENWEVADPTRIFVSLPTIRYLQKNGAKIVLMSHRGRPPKVTPHFLQEKTTLKRIEFTHWSEKLLMEFVAKKLSEIIGQEIKSVPYCIGDEVRQAVKSLKAGEILLLENLRFYAGEKENDVSFSQELASLAEIYINDAFSACHRAHASIVGVPKLLPHYAGFSLIKEVNALEKLLHDTEQPYLLLMGGAKVSDKIGVIQNLLEKVDILCIGGAMALTFFKAKGWAIGASKVEEATQEATKSLLAKIEDSGKTFLLPEDIVVADRFAPDAQAKTVSAQAIPDHWMGLDIGPQTSKLFQEKIRDSSVFFWNGPMGVFEMEPFSHGTRAICAALNDFHGTGIVGGGESAQAAREYAPDAKVYVATGGGASLEYLSGKMLPGIQSLLKEKKEEEK